MMCDLIGNFIYDLLKTERISNGKINFAYVKKEEGTGEKCFMSPDHMHAAVY